MGRFSDAWRRLTQRGNRERGFVEAGVAAAGAVLVVGALVGNGVASTVLDMSDGQTWLPDEDGRIVQINPATGQPERRLVVGGPGSELEVAQRDGHLVVTDLATGAVTAIDLTGLIASGTRGLAGSDSLVLLGGGMVVVVDKSPGTVRAVDPLTLADLGRPHRTADLADAVIDDSGQVWLITTTGQLSSVTFEPRGGTWAVGTDRPVTGAGGQTRLVPHASGATVFAPDGGVVLQVGQGTDAAASVPALEGEVLTALRSPADLVPAAVPQSGLVVLLADRAARTVAVSEIGCGRPGAPQVFNGLVYVPCLGDGRVVALDRDGALVGEPIIVPGGGDPELIVDDGRLIVRTPTDGRIVIVQPDGSTSTVDIAGADVPVQDADRAAPVRPARPVSAPAAGNAPPPPQQQVAGQLPEDSAAPDGRDVSTSPTTPPQRADDVTDPPGASDSTSDAPDRADARTPAAPQDPDTPDGSDAPGQPADPRDPATPADPDPADPGNPADPTDDPTDDGRRPVGDPTDGDPTDGPTGRVTDPTDDAGDPDPTSGAGDPDPSDDGDDSGPDPDPTTDPGEDPTQEPEPTDEPTPDPADRVPGSVRATVQADGGVTVTWAQPAEQPQRFVISASDGSPAVTVPATAASARLTDLTCGRTVTVRVEAQYASGSPGMDTDTVSTMDCDQPTPEAPDPEPTGVRAQLQGNGSVQVAWTAPQEQPASYTVAASDGARVSAGGGATSATLSGLSCEQSLTISVTAHHREGGDGSASTTVQTADCPRDPAPSGVSAQLQGDGDVRVSWTAPSAQPASYTVAASDGGGVTAGGGATSAVLSGLACERTVTVTVTAHHGGGVEGAASTTVTTADCPVAGPDPATPAGGVSATALADGTVRVSWTGASSGADRYVVRPVGGSGTTASASAREVVISGLTPGGSYRFEVETQLEGTTAVSASSNQVTTANVPGTVSGLSAGVEDRNATTVRVGVSFSAASANGAPVTGYVVSYSGGGVSGSTTITGTSTTLTISCSGQALCSAGGALTVSVQATSAVGNGSAVNTTATVAAPPPPPPANGDQRVSGVEHGNPSQADWEIPMYVNISSHPSWSAYGGTCQINVSGAVSNSWNIDCGTSGRMYVASVAQFQSVSVSITAIEAGVTSNTASGEAPARNQWGYCPPDGPCTDPVSLPGDPGEHPPVEIVPAPWTPPEVPNPPVLLAGLLMLGAAGTLRALRPHPLATPADSAFLADSSFTADSSLTDPSDHENRNPTA